MLSSSIKFHKIAILALKMWSNYISHTWYTTHKILKKNGKDFNTKILYFARIEN